MPGEDRGSCKVLRPGTTVAGFQVESLLGRGATATVYRAYQRSLQRNVALKVLAPQLAIDPGVVSRFQREGIHLARLQHDAIVTVFEAGSDGGHLFLAMQLIEGSSLKDHLADAGLLDASEVLAILERVGAGLEHAHRQGFIHRDVKPANILLDTRGRAYLADFGLTKLLTQPGASTGGDLVGTPIYMAPEQSAGRDLSDRTDLYALACVAFECLTGTPPYAGDDIVVLLLAHAAHGVPRASGRNPALAPAVDGVFERALAKDPVDRYESVGAFLAELRAALSMKDRATPAAPGTSPVSRRDAATLCRSGTGAAMRALRLPGTERERILAVAGEPSSSGTPDAAVFPFTGPPVPLFGRESLVGQVCSLLRGPHVRLLSLIGPGGVGKTRLAMELLSRLTPKWPEPPVFIPLDGVQDPELVSPTVGRAIGVRDGPEQGALDAVLEALEGRRVLLVLDNFEHLVEAATDLETIVERCPDATVLVTSRVRLHVRGEQVIEVGALPVPGEGECDPEKLRGYPSVQLFVDRCEAAAGITAPPTSGQLVAVGEICRRLDGLPLALELAAARSRLLGVEGIRVHLGPVLDLLTGGPRDLPQRQRALRSTIEWSYRLLTASCQGVLERIAVFAGGFTFDAAVAVSGYPLMDVVESLAALVDASLIEHMDTDTGESRLRILQTVQDFGLERLAASPDRDQVHLRHARFFADLAEAGDRALQSSAQAHWLRVLDQERDNLRVALTTTITTGCTDEALRLTSAMWRYWEIRGDLVEGRRWLRSALALAGGSSIPRAQALRGAGNLARDQADLQAAERCHSEAMALFAEAGSVADVAACRNNLGNVALDRGDRASAITHYEQALSLLASSGHDGLVAILEQNLGRVVAEDDPERALQFLSSSLARREALGDERGVAWSNSNLGAMHLLRGDVQLAAEYYRSALLVHTAQGDRVGACNCLEGLASVAAASGHLWRSALLLGAADGIRELIGSPVTCDEPGYHRALTAAQGPLAEETLQAAWSEGRAMRFGEWLDLTSE